MKTPSEDASSEEWKEYGDALKRGDHLWKPSLKLRAAMFLSTLFTWFLITLYFTFAALIVLGLGAWALRQMGVL